MYPAPIEQYFQPTTVAETLRLLQEHGAGAHVLAGGQSLLPLLKARTLPARALIDINRVPELAGCQRTAQGLYCGALLRLAEAANHPDIGRDWLALAEAAAAVGDRQVRNRGTVVGSLVFAVHWGDIAPAAAVLAARLCVTGPQGTREVAVESFVRGPRLVQLAAHELAVGLLLPPPPPHTGSGYLKHGRVTQDRATVGVAVRLTRSANGTCTAARIAIGGLAQHPICRAFALEARLRDQPLNADLLREIAQLAATTIATHDDELASAAYRRQLLSVYVPRALELAWHRSTENVA